MRLMPGCKALAVLLLLASLFSCGKDSSGSGGSGADFMSVTVNDGAPVSFIETVNRNAHFGFDPYVASTFDSTNGQMYLFAHADYNSGVPTLRMDILINGSQPGTYTIAGGSHVFYTPVGGLYSTSASQPPSGGTISVTRFDGTGGLVQGSYDVIALVGTGSTTTAHLTGSFSVTRD
jgi:hypothetical protein